MHEVDAVCINSLVSPSIITDFYEHNDCTLQSSILFMSFWTVFGAEVVKKVRNRLLQLVYNDHVLKTCFSLAWVVHISLHSVEKFKHKVLLQIKVLPFKTSYDFCKWLSLVCWKFLVPCEMSNALFQKPVNTKDKIFPFLEHKSCFFLLSKFFTFFCHV